MKTFILTALALMAFAANSLLARAGLVNPDMGAEEFTLIRLIAGAVTLALLVTIMPKEGNGTPRGSWWGGGSLLLYALMFSLAYVSLDTGFGALCLFTVVQLTILGEAAYRRDLSRWQVIGALIAFAGFVYLVQPSLGTPDVSGIIMMAMSGFGWGIYTVLGRGAKAPLVMTAGNFWRAALLALTLLILILPSPTLTQNGILFAVISGAITSGCGYAVWYAVLPRLSRAMTASSQLLVPPLAAIMGWALLGEILTLRLMIATLIILAGLYIVALRPRRHVTATRR